MTPERLERQEALDWISNLADNYHVEKFWDRLDKLETDIRRGVNVTPAIIEELNTIEEKGKQHEEFEDARLESGNNRGQLDEGSGSPAPI